MAEEVNKEQIMLVLYILSGSAESQQKDCLVFPRIRRAIRDI